MIDPETFAVASRRQWFHVLWDSTPAQVASVLEHGLERERTRYPDFWASRPGHVYFGSMAHLRDHLKFFEPTDREVAVFAVDVSELDLGRIDPDEDHFHLSRTGGLGVMQRFRLETPPSKWAWEWARYLKITPPPSLGEWAEAIGLGHDPATTRHSARSGSLSYCGVVPPAALKQVAVSDLPTLEEIEAAEQSDRRRLARLEPLRPRLLEALLESARHVPRAAAALLVPAADLFGLERQRDGKLEPVPRFGALLKERA